MQTRSYNGARRIDRLSASDPDGDVLAFSDGGLPGFCTALVDNGNGTGSITCNPDMADNGDFPVTVTVTDNGLPNLVDSELFNIHVPAFDGPPSADAGPDQSVTNGTLVTLDGSNSFDFESTAMQFAWRFLSVPASSSLADVNIANATTASPSFTPDAGGDYTVELQVTDDAAQTATDTVVITSNAPLILYGIHKDDSSISSINKSTGAAITTTATRVPGETITEGNGLAVNPSTNEMYAAVKLASTGGNNRTLIKIDPLTGNAVVIGHMGEPIASLSFDSRLGGLYGVSGDCLTANCASANPETIFTVNLGDASLTIFLALGNGGAGEAIGYSPFDGEMYHMSGLQGAAPGIIFEKIDVIMGDVVDIAISDPAPADGQQTMGIVYDETHDLFIGNFVGVDPTTGIPTVSDLFTISSSGVRTPFAVPQFAWKDFAFWSEVLPLATSVKGDLDGDGNSDILWRNSTGEPPTGTGQNWMYLMNGATISSRVGVNTVPTDWDIVNVD